MGSLAFHQMQENEFTQSQSSQGESPYQRDAFVSFYLFIFLGGWGDKSILKAGRLFLQPGNICFTESLSTLIFIFMQGGNSGFLTENWVGGTGGVVLPRVELALMRFSCNYFSAITIRTTTTEDLIRQ